MVFICHLDHSVAKCGMYSICNFFLKIAYRMFGKTFELRSYLNFGSKVYTVKSLSTKLCVCLHVSTKNRLSLISNKETTPIIISF